MTAPPLYFAPVRSCASPARGRTPLYSFAACMPVSCCLLYCCSLDFFALVTCRGRTPTRVDYDVLRLALPCVCHEDVCQCMRVPSVSRALPSNARERRARPSREVVVRRRAGGVGERRAEVGGERRSAGEAGRCVRIKIQDILRIAKRNRKNIRLPAGATRRPSLTESESASRSCDPPSDLMMMLLGKTKVWAPDWISI